MVIYFSGTGNSKYCAETLAKYLNDEIVDSRNYIKNEIAGEFVSGKPYVFVAPVYAWRIPFVFSDFIRSSHFDGNKDAYFFITCGGEMGAAGVKARSLTKEVGLSFKGAIEVAMPNNYIISSGAPSDNRCKKYIAHANKLMKKYTEEIAKGEIFPEHRVSFVDSIKSGPINAVFNKYFITAKDFRATENCIGCGNCVTFCPLGNISLEDNKPQWGDRCTQCFACICLCPTDAIEFGKVTVGKKRYKGPEAYI